MNSAGFGDFKAADNSNITPRACHGFSESSQKKLFLGSSAV